MQYFARNLELCIQKPIKTDKAKKKIINKSAVAKCRRNSKFNEKNLCEIALPKATNTKTFFVSGLYRSTFRGKIGKRCDYSHYIQGTETKRKIEWKRRLFSVLSLDYVL